MCVDNVVNQLASTEEINNSIINIQSLCIDNAVYTYNSVHFMQNKYFAFMRHPPCVVTELYILIQNNIYLKTLIPDAFR